MSQDQRESATYSIAAITNFTEKLKSFNEQGFESIQIKQQLADCIEKMREEYRANVAVYRNKLNGVASTAISDDEIAKFHPASVLARLYQVPDQVIEALKQIIADPSYAVDIENVPGMLERKSELDDDKLDNLAEFSEHLWLAGQVPATLVFCAVYTSLGSDISTGLLEEAEILDPFFGAGLAFLDSCAALFKGLKMIREAEDREDLIVGAGVTGVGVASLGGIVSILGMSDWELLGLSTDHFLTSGATLAEEVASGALFGFSAVCATAMAALDLYKANKNNIKADALETGMIWELEQGDRLDELTKGEMIKAISDVVIRHSTDKELPLHQQWKLFKSHATQVEWKQLLDAAPQNLRDDILKAKALRAEAKDCQNTAMLNIVYAAAAATIAISLIAGVSVMTMGIVPAVMMGIALFVGIGKGIAGNINKKQADKEHKQYLTDTVDEVFGDDINEPGFNLAGLELNKRFTVTKGKENTEMSFKEYLDLLIKKDPKKADAVVGALSKLAKLSKLEPSDIKEIKEARHQLSEALHGQSLSKELRKGHEALPLGAKLFREMVAEQVAKVAEVTQGDERMALAESSPRSRARTDLGDMKQTIKDIAEPNEPDSPGSSDTASLSEYDSDESAEQVVTRRHSI